MNIFNKEFDKELKISKNNIFSLKILLNNITFQSSLSYKLYNAQTLFQCGNFSKKMKVPGIKVYLSSLDSLFFSIIIDGNIEYFEMIDKKDMILLLKNNSQKKESSVQRQKNIILKINKKSNYKKISSDEDESDNDNNDEMSEDNDQDSDEDNDEDSDENSDKNNDNSNHELTECELCDESFHNPHEKIKLLRKILPSNEEFIICRSCFHTNKESLISDNWKFYSFNNDEINDDENHSYLDNQSDNSHSINKEQTILSSHNNLHDLMDNLQNNENINSHFIQEIISENNSISSQKSNTRHTSIDQLSEQNSLDGEFNCSVCHELQTSNICFNCKRENICETCDGNGDQDENNGLWICQTCFDNKKKNISTENSNKESNETTQNNNVPVQHNDEINQSTTINEHFISEEHITL